MRRLPILLSLAAAATVAACTEVGTDPTAVVAIQFDSLPAPSVVQGEVLRDLQGDTAAFRAIVFNAEGDTIAAPDVRYLVLYPDTAFGVDTVGASGIFVAPEGFLGQVRVVAQAGRLQSAPPLVLEITRRPDSLAQLGDTTRQLGFGTTDTVATSDTLAVAVRHRLATGGDTLVKAWPVRYRILTTAGAPVDTAIATVVNELGRVAPLDTTDARGLAVRRVRVRRTALPNAVDTLVVQVSSQHAGAPLAGSPATFFLVVTR